jgi:hypothetical protein
MGDCQISGQPTTDARVFPVKSSKHNRRDPQGPVGEGHPRAATADGRYELKYLESAPSRSCLGFARQVTYDRILQYHPPQSKGDSIFYYMNLSSTLYLILTQPLPSPTKIPANIG